MPHKWFDMIISILIIVAIISAILLFFIHADAEIITLTWDAPSESHDGVKIYQKTAREGDNYDFTSPAADIPFPGSTAEIEVLGEPDAVLKYIWVARAYRNELESSNSNEVGYKVINIPPLVPVALTAAQQGTVIEISWEQPSDPYLIDHWILYARTGEDPFIDIGNVTDGDNLTLTRDLSDMAPHGEVTVVTFTVVAFRRSGVFSANSTEATVSIDRRTLPPVENLRIEVAIPL